MNIRPVFHTALSVLLSFAAATAIMLLGCAAALRTDDPLTVASAIGVGAYLVGALLSGFLSARGGDFHPLAGSLFGGALYGLTVLVIFLFCPGETGVARHLLMLGGGLALSAGGGALLLVRMPRRAKSNARKKFLRSRK